MPDFRLCRPIHLPPSKNNLISKHYVTLEGYKLLNFSPLENTIESMRFVDYLFIVPLVHLQAFFWMNVLCYDIFRAFRKIRLTSVASKERDDIRKLLFYTMYASGAPMIIIILSVVVEYQPQTYAGPRPQFGVERCFFGSDVGSFIFFHLPLMIIQVSTSFYNFNRIIFCSVILEKCTLLGNCTVSAKLISGL